MWQLSPEELTNAITPTLGCIIFLACHPLSFLFLPIISHCGSDYHLQGLPHPFWICFYLHSWKKSDLCLNAFDRQRRLDKALLL